MSAWKIGLEDAPRDGSPVKVRVVKTLRFLPYKPNSEQRRRGIEGRWQELNEHGGWDNCATPTGCEWKAGAQ